MIAPYLGKDFVGCGNFNMLSADPCNGFEGKRLSDDSLGEVKSREDEGSFDFTEAGWESGGK
jgi:hypothetical protein